jgi:hypothetical protein
MSQTTRRIFLMQVAAAGSALTATQVRAQAQAPAPAVKNLENDPLSIQMGFTYDSTKADGKKYPKHTNDQTCANCQLFGGKAGDEWGPCPIYGGKLVFHKGWCSAHLKKPA